MAVTVGAGIPAAPGTMISGGKTTAGKTVPGERVSGWGGDCGCVVACCGIVTFDGDPDVGLGSNKTACVGGVPGCTTAVTCF